MSGGVWLYGVFKKEAFQKSFCKFFVEHFELNKVKKLVLACVKVLVFCGIVAFSTHSRAA